METKEKNEFEIYLDIFRRELPLGESFDLLERKLIIGGRRASVFFVDGLHDSDKALLLFKFLLAVPAESMEGIKSSQEFLERNLPFMEAEITEPTDAITKMYTGLIPLVVEGLDKIIIMDARHYPARAVEEPEKEKTLRGAKDGFNETLMTNIGLIRRRIRDKALIFKAYNVGSVSKSDVALVYMKDRADMEFVHRMENALSKMSRKASPFGEDSKKDTDESSTSNATKSALTVSDQSMLEKLLREFDAGSGINPFPRVRYSQRPDVIAAHINEGKVAIIVDNTPTVMLIPTGIFEFFQDVDDYYFPLLTGNYFRFIKLLNFL